MKGNVSSKGVKQRTHQVKIDGNDVYVLSKPASLYKEKITSDDYAYKGLWKIPKGNGPSKIHSQRSNLPPAKNVFFPK
jgi:hypothetical protein